VTLRRRRGNFREALKAGTRECVASASQGIAQQAGEASHVGASGSREGALRVGAGGDQHAPFGARVVFDARARDGRGGVGARLGQEPSGAAALRLLSRGVGLLRRAAEHAREHPPRRVVDAQAAPELARVEVAVMARLCALREHAEAGQVTVGELGEVQQLAGDLEAELGRHVARGVERVGVEEDHALQTGERCEEVKTRSAKAGFVARLEQIEARILGHDARARVGQHFDDLVASACLGGHVPQRRRPWHVAHGRLTARVAEELAGAGARVLAFGGEGLDHLEGGGGRHAMGHGLGAACAQSRGDFGVVVTERAAAKAAGAGVEGRGVGLVEREVALGDMVERRHLRPGRGRLARFLRGHGTGEAAELRAEGAVGVRSPVEREARRTLHGRSLGHAWHSRDQREKAVI